MYTAPYIKEVISTLQNINFRKKKYFKIKKNLAPCPQPFIQYMVLDIQFRSVNYTTLTTMHKNFEKSFVPIQEMQAITVSR